MWEELLDVYGVGDLVFERRGGGRIEDKGKGDDGLGGGEVEFGREDRVG